MRTCLYILAMTLLCWSCNPDAEQNNAVIVHGEVANMADTTLTFQFYHHDYLVRDSSIRFNVAGDGSFGFAFEPGRSVDGFISFGKVPKTYQFTIQTPEGKDSSLSVSSVDFRSFNLWLEPGDSLYIKVDPDRIKQTLDISGQGAANNQLFNLKDWRFNDYRHKYLRNYYQYAAFSAEDHRVAVNKLYLEKLELLENFPARKDLSSAFVDHYEYNAIKDQIQSLSFYPSQSSYFNDGKSTVLPDDYYTFLEHIDIPNEITNKGVAYIGHLHSLLRTWYEHDKTKQAEDTDMQWISGYHFADDSSRDAYYQFVLSRLPDQRAYELLAYVLGYDFNRNLYELFGDNCPYPDLAQRVRKHYQHLLSTLPGSLFPNVFFEDTDGNQVTPDEFHGELVYIDFWATWCKPCIAEIPYLEILQETFHHDPIRFVSISIDREADHDKWLDFVTDHHMKGSQLWINQKQGEMLKEALNIHAIPHFVLLDTEGKILQAKAPRPSEKKIIDLLHSHLQ